MANDPIQTFVDMSSVLTGFESEVLAPALDPQDPPLKKQYFEVVQQYDAQLLDQLLAQFQTLQGQGLPDQEIANDLVAATQGTNPAAPTATLARAIVKLWYLGSWYPPNSPNTPVVVSANAYIGGLAWRTAQAKAMGYSELNFGYWSQPPLPLSAFGVGTGGNGGQ
jgi:hypothetical protein